MWADPEVVRHIGGSPFSEEDVWARIMRYVGHWELLGFGTWIVRERSGAFVGEVGFFDLHRAITPTLDIPEVGWALARSAQGKGYATEALQAVLAWGRERFGTRPMSCMIEPENRASLRVADKCGFHEYRRTVYKGDTVIILRR